jgi:hypothetical protein
MNPRALLQFRACVAFAIIGAALAVLTSVWPDWIEAVSGFSLDKGNGATEDVITAVFAAATVIAGGLARAQWHRAHPATGSSPD